MLDYDRSRCREHQQTAYNVNAAETFFFPKGKYPTGTFCAMLRPPISSHHPIPSISSYLIRCHSHVCTTPFVPWSQNIGYFHQFSGLSFHACRIPASVMLGFAPPRKEPYFLNGTWPWHIWWVSCAIPYRPAFPVDIPSAGLA